MRRRGSLKGPSAKIADSGSDRSSKKKKKQNVIEIDGALWALDEYGNPLKRLRKKTKDGAANEGGSSSGGKKKKNVTEIDGQPWLLDEYGNPVKKLRKKVKDGDNSSDEKDSKRRAPSRTRSGSSKRRGYDSDGGSSRGSNRRNGRVRGREEITRRERSKSRGRNNNARQHSDSEDSSSEKRGKKPSEGSLEHLMDSSSQRRKKKKQIVEIDGQLWACDANGNPVKKVRRKGGEESDGEQRGRSQSRGPARDNARSKSRPAAPASRGVRRNDSFTDDKGRRHVFDEHGSESVFDKSGKKLRKKGQPKPQPPAKSFSPIQSPPEKKKDLLNRSSREVEFGIFDHLWDDTSVGGSTRKSLGESNRFSLGDSERASRMSILSPKMPTRSSIDSIKENGGDPTGISQQIAQVDKQNQKLLLELEKAKKETKTMADQARKEKAKNIKTMSDMMQLKAEYHDANSELLQLRNKVNDLSSEIQEKERELTTAKEENAVNPTMEGEEGIAELEAEKDNLQSKLQLEKATAQQEIKKKEEQLAHMNRELGVLRNELEMLITGKKGNMAVDPIMVRLLREKKEFEERYNQEKEVNSIKISSLQEMIDTLETMNQELNKQMLLTKKGNQNTGLQNTGLLNSSVHGRNNDFHRKPPAPTRSFDGGLFNVSPGALSARTWFGRRGSVVGGTGEQ